jgi:hypothetical protein
MQISRSKPDSLHRTPAGFTALALDGYGLCDILPARPTSAASYPVSVRRVATLLHASFRQSLAVLPLRFASASPPSGCTGDLHPQNCRTCPTHRMPPQMRRHRRSRRKPSLTERARCYPCPGGTAPRRCPAGLLPRFFSLDHWWEVLSPHRRVHCEPDTYPTPIRMAWKV